MKSGQAASRCPRSSTRRGTGPPRAKSRGPGRFPRGGRLPREGGPAGEEVRPYLIAIAGPSCSGKTALAERLARRLGRTRTVILPLDAYYRDRARLDLPSRRRCNFDEPAALEWALLRRQMLALAGGREVERPVYDFASCTRRRATVTLRLGRFLIVEGLFALQRPWLRRLCGTKVFVEVGEGEARRRRLRRDVGERGSPLAFVTRQYAETVLPMARRHILPTRRHADLVISGDEAPGRAVAAILDHLRRQEGARSSAGGAPGPGSRAGLRRR